MNKICLLFLLLPLVFIDALGPWWGGGSGGGKKRNNPDSSNNIPPTPNKRPAGIRPPPPPLIKVDRMADLFGSGSTTRIGQSAAAPSTIPQYGSGQPIGSSTNIGQYAPAHAQNWNPQPASGQPIGSSTNIGHYAPAHAQNWNPQPASGQPRTIGSSTNNIGQYAPAHAQNWNPQPASGPVSIPPPPAPLTDQSSFWKRLYDYPVESMLSNPAAEPSTNPQPASVQQDTGVRHNFRQSSLLWDPNNNEVTLQPAPASSRQNIHQPAPAAPSTIPQAASGSVSNPPQHNNEFSFWGQRYDDIRPSTIPQPGSALLEHFGFSNDYSPSGSNQPRTAEPSSQRDRRVLQSNARSLRFNPNSNELIPPQPVQQDAGVQHSYTQSSLALDPNTNKITIQRGSQSAERHLCTKCGRPYQSKDKLNRHTRYECDTVPQFKCPYPNCPFSSKQNSYIKQHIQNKHSNQK